MASGSDIGPTHNSWLAACATGRGKALACPDLATMHSVFSGVHALAIFIVIIIHFSFVL